MIRRRPFPQSASDVVLPVYPLFGEMPRKQCFLQTKSIGKEKKANDVYNVLFLLEGSNLILFQFDYYRHIRISKITAYLRQD